MSYISFDTGRCFAIAEKPAAPGHRVGRRVAEVRYRKMKDGKCDDYDQAKRDADMIVSALNVSDAARRAAMEQQS